MIRAGSRDILFFVAGLALWLMVACGELGHNPASAAVEHTVTWAADVGPLLAARCLACHGPGGGYGRLDLSSPAGLLAGGSLGPAVIPGEPDSSLVMQRLDTADPARRMPPGGNLSPADLQLVREWILAGADE